MAYGRKDFRGDAVPTTIAAPITALSTSWDIVDATGWPDGTNGPFGIVMNRKYGQANLDGSSPEEKALVTSRVGTTLTLADSSARGADGTTPQAWSPPTSIEHCLFASDLDEANLTVAQTIGQVQAKGDILTGKSANRFQRTAAGSDNSLYVVDSSQPGGMRFGGLPAGGINDPNQIVDALIPPQKLSGLVMTAVQIDALTGADLFIGHQVYQLDTSVARPWPGLYVYNGFAWTPPWNTAWGRISTVKVTTTRPGFGAIADITGLTTGALTFVANRNVRVTIKATYSQNSHGQPALYVNDGTTSFLVWEIQDTTTPGTGGRATGSHDLVTVAGDLTLKGRCASAPGTVDLFASTTQPIVLTVDDAGPAGAPA